MKHQTGGTGWASGNILDFHAGLPEVWGSNPSGEKFVNYTVSGKKRGHSIGITDVIKNAVNTDKDGHLTKAFQTEINMTLQVNC